MDQLQLELQQLRHEVIDLRKQLQKQGTTDDEEKNGLSTPGSTPTPPLKALFNFAERPPIDDKPLFGDFTRLQRLNLTQLQNELATLKADLRASDGPTEGQVKDIRRTLHAYGMKIPRESTKYSFLNGSTKSALETAHRSTLVIERSESPSHRKRDIVREMLRKHLHRSLAWSQQEKEARAEDYWLGKEPLIYSTSVDRIARFIMAFLGGAALLVPMLIMIFHPSRTKSLITTSVAVLLFAAFLALLNSSNQETLVATATYAAVLVVFVGTSISTGNS